MLDLEEWVWKRFSDWYETKNVKQCFKGPGRQFSSEVIYLQLSIHCVDSREKWSSYLKLNWNPVTHYKNHCNFWLVLNSSRNSAQLSVEIIIISSTQIDHQSIFSRLEKIHVLMVHWDLVLRKSMRTKKNNQYKELISCEKRRLHKKLSGCKKQFAYSHNSSSPLYMHMYKVCILDLVKSRLR